MPDVTVRVCYKNPAWTVTVDREPLDRTESLVRHEAIQAGRALAKQMHAELVVQDADGSIAARESYRVGLL